MTDNNGIVIRIKGKVQGVGFRPFVWQLANELSLYGNVSNDSYGVLIHLWQEPATINLFLAKLKQQCPPLARIDHITKGTFQWQTKPIKFEIITSQNGEMDTLIVPDTATCDACQLELNSAGDRRYQYPFINCTHCGPRFTIIEQMPYDRPNTTMASFVLCTACQDEYESPNNRRFHAQPTACPECGPKIWVSSSVGEPLTEKTQALALIVEKLTAGKTIAIKSIGGFHLACDATQNNAVLTLRQRKKRPNKPLAVMLPDDSWLPYCVSSDVNLTKLTKLLKSPAAPIVLTQVNPNSPISNHVAPNLNEIGIMLPSNPLHHLLLNHYKKPLIMTSGNANGLPPALTNQEALLSLKSIADYWLLHDREIVQRADDSVVRIGKNKPEILRRARGYVPDSLTLPDGFDNSLSILAMGADRKNTFCLLKNTQVILSQHLGDLNSLVTQQQYRNTLDLWLTTYQHKLDLIAVDAHPNYITHQLGVDYSKQFSVPIVPVYHHHAHIAACLAEHDYPLDAKPVIGIVLDGLGYGQNGQLWGGECLVADYQNCHYFGGLPSVAMPGGDLAAKQPWRNLLAHLLTFVPNWQHTDEAKHISTEQTELMIKAVVQGVNSPKASSTGRLFDAIAAALGIAPTQISWEGEAACKLEALANQYQGEVPVISMRLTSDMKLDLHQFWQTWLTFKAPITERAYAFHVALASGIAKLAKTAAQQNQLTSIVLTGGVMQNKLLRRLITESLSDYKLLLPYKFPANDGSIALGQVLIATALYNSKIEINK